MRGASIRTASRLSGPLLWSRWFCCSLMVWGALALSGCIGQPAGYDREQSSFQRTGVFLAAADYRRAIEECQRIVMERPSAESYAVLTYVYQALDAYVESLVKADRWVAVELLAASLGTGRPEELLDSPDVLARVAKELIQASARRHSDVSAAMAARLDEQAVSVLWSRQQAWRRQRPDGWWLGLPHEWKRPGRDLTP